MGESVYLSVRTSCPREGLKTDIEGTNSSGPKRTSLTQPDSRTDEGQVATGPDGG